MSDIVVVDASVALKWLMAEVHSDIAAALLLKWTEQQTHILAPILLTSEIANALYKRVRQGDLTSDNAYMNLEDFLKLGIEYISDPALSLRALELTVQHGLKAVYDTHYLALAERESCELWTADERLWNSVKSTLTWVRWIGNAPTPGHSLP